MNTTTTLLVREFPDYDVTTLPVIPEGFVDSSWHNDACPSFTKGNLQLFVDYADPAMRETEYGGKDSPRFVLIQEDAEPLVVTDNWSEVLAAIEAAQ